jgi:drug/metabolite transporter (DMT)-like permease
MLIACVATGTALVGYSQDEWVKIAALTVTGQLLAHSLTNTVVARVSPTFVSMAGLLSVPIAAVLAAAWLRQVPPVMALPSLIVILAGIALAIRSGGAGSSEE